MRSRRLGLFLALLVTLILPSLSQAYESKVVAEYLKAADAKDANGKAAIIKENIGRIPSEVKALLYEAAMARTSQEEKEANYYIAEMLAKSVFDITGDSSLLIEVKQNVFNARLTPQVRSKLQGNVHIVEFPKTPEGEHHTFKPDNISISAGETVRWVNRDEIAHIFASMPVIGKGGIFTPNIEPDDGWEYTFETPGDYYYICFIHKGMIGKVTVTAPKKSDKAAAGNAETKKAAPAKKTAPAASPEDAKVPTVVKKKGKQYNTLKSPDPSEDEDVFDDF